LKAIAVSALSATGAVVAAKGTINYTKSGIGNSILSATGYMSDEDRNNRHSYSYGLFINAARFFTGLGISVAAYKYA
jgi:hypothetical protein